MVLLVVDTTSSECTVYFDKPIEKPNYVRLISCALYNSWHTLKAHGEITLKRNSKPTVTKTIHRGHYTLESMAEHLKIVFSEEGVELRTEINTPVGAMVIRAGSGKKILLDSNLSKLFFGASSLPFTTFLPRLIYPTSYFIHCDVIEQEQNLFNGKPSSILACVDISGKSYEKVSYTPPAGFSARVASPKQYVNSLTLSVKDENGELFDFNDFPLLFELEIS